MKILITGSDPFGGETVNPAYEAVKLLPDTIAGAEIIKLEVPTRFHRAGAVLEDAMQRHKPDAVICVGQAGGRAAITPGESGHQPYGRPHPGQCRVSACGPSAPIREDGETAYFTSLPVKAMVQRMRDAGIPAAVSYTAGTYVCNYLLYTLLYLIDKKYPNVRGGFIHVPYAMEDRSSISRWAPPAWTCAKLPADWKRRWKLWRRAVKIAMP